MSPSLNAEATASRRDLTPFAVRVFEKEGDAVQACNRGFSYWKGPRKGWTSRPTADRTDWNRMREYVIDADPGYLTHQNNAFLNRHFRVPGFVAPIKIDIQNEDRRLFPTIPFDAHYQPPTNGLNQVWCSKADAHYEYLKDAGLVDAETWAAIGCNDFLAKIGLVFECYFKMKGIGFALIYPQKRG